MITAEIKLYEEPKPVEISKYTKYDDLSTFPHHNYDKWTDEEIANAIVEAQEKVKIGDQFRYKSGSGIITVVGYTNNRQGMYNGNYGLNVIEAKREATQHMPESIQRYGINEFFSTWIERITNAE
jgi:hypothetical protein